MMWPYYSDGSWVWMLAMMLVMLVFWGGIIGVVIWAVRAFIQQRPPGDSAMETLRRRLAAGELSQEEFEKTRRLLQGQQSLPRRPFGSRLYSRWLYSSH